MPENPLAVVGKVVNVFVRARLFFALGHRIAYRNVSFLAGGPSASVLPFLVSCMARSANSRLASRSSSQFPLRAHFVNVN